MDGKQLRNSILQWAIQGKLVPQDPNDEPASVLLERIREEKAHLVKEKKIKRDKNESIIYRGDDNSYYEKFTDGKVVCIDDVIPFDLPEGWQWCRVRDVSRSYIGLTYKPSDVSQKGTIVLRSSNIQNGKLDLNDIVRVSSDIPEKLWVEKNDIIICARNGSKRLVGKSAIIDAMNESMTFGAFMAICKTPFYKYIYLFLQSDLFFSQLREVSGTTTINQLTQNNFNRFLVPIPPVNEQERIVEFCSTLMPYIERYGIAQDQLNELNINLRPLLRKSILQEAIQGRLVEQSPDDAPASVLLERIMQEKERLIKEKKIKRDKQGSIIFRGDDNKYYEKRGKEIICIDDDIPFYIPDSWAWTRLFQVADLYTGNSISETEKKLKFTNVIGRYYIGTKDVGFDNNVFYNNGVAIPKQYEHDFRIAPNHSILMCIEGGSAGRKIAILNQDVCFGNKLCCFSPFVEIGKYIYYYLQSTPFLDMFNEKKTGIIGGVSIARVKEILIPIPPFDEMGRITSKIDTLFHSLN